MRAFFERYLVEFALWSLAILCFRNALGRADVPHIRYSSLLSFVLFFLLLFKHIPEACASWDALYARSRRFLAPLLVLLVCASSIYCTYRIAERDTLAAAFPFGTPDEAY